MRKSARKAAFFFSTAILIMVLCNGCAIKLAQSAADHIYENYAVEGKSPTEVAADTMTGMSQDLFNYAADLGTELGIAAAEIANQLGTALGSVYSDQSLADKNEAVSRAEQELVEKGADSLDKAITETIDNLNMNIDRYSELIRNGRQESGVVMPEKSDLLGPFCCDYAYDGDTISLCPEADEALGLPDDTRYRLIGIDCPESVARSDYYKENTEQGRTSSKYTKNLVIGKNVYLQYDVQREDKYGRKLVYVFLDEDGLPMLQEILLSQGLAQVMTIQPNSRYSQWFSQLQHEAAENGAGFWGDGFFTEKGDR